MVLSRVVVEPGAKLALHHHLGTQISRIASGTLTYTVRQGSAVVREGDAEKDPRLVRTIAAGQTARIKPGQWLVEQPSDIHEAANRGSDAGRHLPRDAAEERRAARDAGHAALTGACRLAL